MMPRFLSIRFTALLFAAMVTACALAEHVAANHTRSLRIVGGLATGNRYAKLEQPFWTSELAKISGGKFTAEIVPFDRAGVPGQDMLRMMQLGVIPFGTALLSHMAVDAPEFSAPDLAGLNPDIATLRKVVSAFRPHLEKTLRDRYRVEVLAVYVYPAQVLFCKRPFNKLTDLAGRRTRVSSATGADFIEALGGMPVLTEFSELMPNIASGNTECAITAALAGNKLGLHEVATHLYNLPVTWGLSVFAVNSSAWHAVDPELRSLLTRELPRLERAIWDDAERDTLLGIACNSGIGECVGGRKGNMTIVQPSAEDNRQRQQILRTRVIPNWIRRCGSQCERVWDETVNAAIKPNMPTQR